MSRVREKQNYKAMRRVEERKGCETRIICVGAKKGLKSSWFIHSVRAAGTGITSSGFQGLEKATPYFPPVHPIRDYRMISTEEAIYTSSHGNQYILYLKCFCLLVRSCYWCASCRYTRVYPDPLSRMKWYACMVGSTSISILPLRYVGQLREEARERASTTRRINRVRCNFPYSCKLEGHDGVTR
jgi:hypothetical protein